MRGAAAMAAGAVLTLAAIGAAAALAFVVVSSVDPEELVINRVLLAARPFLYATTAEAVVSSLARSLAILIPALAGGALIGMAIALVHQHVRAAPLRAALWTFALVAAALPAFFWALLAELANILVFFAMGRHLLPFGGFGLDERLILPVVTLGLRPLAVAFRTTAVALADVSRRDHVTAARARGLPEHVILLRHVLPNVTPEAVAGVAYAARNSLSSLAIVEYVYSWGGAGHTFLQSVILADVELAVALLATFVALHMALGALARAVVAGSAAAK